MNGYIDKDNYYLYEIYNNLDYWKEIIQLNGNLLISFGYSKFVTFYEFFKKDPNDISKLNIVKSTYEINIKDDLSLIRNISRMNDGSVLGLINNKIIIIKIQKDKEGKIIPKCYLLDYKESNILKIIELSNGKFLICDNSNKLSIFNYNLNKTENTNKGMVKSFFKKISNSITSNNSLVKESEIQFDFNFNDDKILMTTEIIYNNSKIITFLNQNNHTLYFYESAGGIYNIIFEIANVNSNYIKQICNCYLLGFSKGNKSKYIELISLEERKVCSKLKINDLDKNDIIDITINYKKINLNEYEYFIVLLRKNYFINKIYFNPLKNVFKSVIENEFIELKSLNKEWPKKIIEFQKDKDENQYILFSDKNIYLMNNKKNDFLTLVFIFLLFVFLLAVIEYGDVIDIVLYIVAVFLSGKLFYDYKYSSDKTNFLKIKNNSDLFTQLILLFIVWFLKLIGLFNFFISFIFGVFFAVLVIIFFIKAFFLL